MSEAAAFQQSFSAMLRDTGAIRDNALRRAVAIHRNTSIKAALDALGDNYPVLRALVGEDAFNACGLAYVEDVPPADLRLCLYGDGFSSHILGWEAFRDLPYLGAVAHLERLVIEALFAADAPALDPSSLTDGLDLDMPVKVHPATRIGIYDCPAVSLWLAHQEGSGLDLGDVHWAPEIALVTRPDPVLEARAIDRATYDFLTAPTLGAAAAAAHAQGADVAAIFSTLLTSGALAV